MKEKEFTVEHMDVYGNPITTKIKVSGSTRAEVLEGVTVIGNNVFRNQFLVSVIEQEAK